MKVKVIQTQSIIQIPECVEDLVFWKQQQIKSLIKHRLNLVPARFNWQYYIVVEEGDIVYDYVRISQIMDEVNAIIEEVKAKEI